ncbi:hypothetical protein TeGR_g12442 [Tetraparma gracilis]|uniref:Uncharacterized protein n=1 Tax=Tetraparma gracilis TaxID=2962635 RepID=A0ABQ6N3W7_9STRA|nr:hypothetical protein TeGR_g12442 [Tetraparma gracilis]
MLSSASSFVKSMKSKVVAVDDNLTHHTPEELDTLLEDVQRVFEHTVQEIVIKLAEVDPDALRARAAETGISEGELMGACLPAVTSALDEKKEEEERKKAKMAERMETKRPATSGEAVLRDISGAYERDVDAYRERQLGVDAKDFLDWGIPQWTAFIATARYVLTMLSIVSIFSASSWVNVMATREVVMRSAPTNITSSEDIDETAVSNENVALYLLASAVTISAVGYCVVIRFLNLRHVQSYVLLAATVPVGVMPLFLYYHLGGEHSSGIALGVAFAIISCGQITAMCFAFLTEKDADDGNVPIWVAGARAQHLLEKGEELQKMSVLKKLQLSCLLAVPNLFTYFILMFLVVGIFALYNAFESSGWKVAVTLLALGIKVTGNKVLLGLLGGGIAVWLSDNVLYMYEIGTALILRILQLSIPDERTAQITCLFGAVAEVSVRIYFYVNFLKVGFRNKRMSTKEQRDYATRGKLRVQDGSNDMVVEYMSSIIAGFFMIYLAPTGIFSFAAEATVSADVVIKIMFYQLVPEIFMDFFVTYMDVSGGLGKLHANYWSWSGGSDKKNRFWAFRVGDLPKAFAVKLTTTWFITSFVLLVVLRKRA